MQDFLPVTKKEMKQRGWEQVDFAYITGDAYVDHPSFGTAIISRLLESRGYKVGIIPQPDWRKKESIQVFGEPRLGFLVSAGNMDSMVNHYTVSKKHRQKDSYSPGGQMGLRPDRAVIVYSNLIRQTYKKTPIILGGIEASLRRLAHYDYWENKVKHSVLLDSGADMISYGMGEHSIIEIADALASGLPVEELTYIAGTVFKCRDLSRVYDPIILPSYEEVKVNKKVYADSFAIQYQNTDPFSARPMVESYGTKGYIIQNPPALPLTQEEMDDVYALPYTEKVHPMYEKLGGIPALEEIKLVISCTGFYFQNSLEHFQECDIKGSPTQVIDQDVAFLFHVVKTIAECGCCRFINNAFHLKTCQISRLYYFSALSVIKIGRNRYHSSCNLFSQML